MVPAEEVKWTRRRRRGTSVGDPGPTSAASSLAIACSRDGEQQIGYATTETEAVAAGASPAEDTVDMCLVSTTTVKELEDAVCMHVDFVSLGVSVAMLNSLSENRILNTGPVASP